MAKSKSIKRALLFSITAMLLCVSMLIGTTFAWFTDSASTGVNKIVAGSLDIDIVDANDENVSFANTALNFKAADSRENILWEPGCTYVLPAFKIANKGNLWLKYNVVLSGVTGTAELLDVIDFYVFNTTDMAAIEADIQNGTAVSLEEYFALKDDDLTAGGIPLEPEKSSDTIVIAGHMRDNAGNEYMGKELDGIEITVLAAQYTKERDSFNEKYDENAEYAWSVSDKDLLWKLYNSGKNVTLSTDIDTWLYASLTGGTEFKMNLNGKTIYFSEPYGDRPVIQLDGGTLTINGEGSVIGCYENSAPRTVIRSNSYGIFNIENGYYTNALPGAELSDTYDCSLIDVSHYGEIYISGGTFKCVTPEKTLVRNTDTSKIVVTGGSFFEFDPSAFVADGYKVVSETQANGETWYKVVAE